MTEETLFILLNAVAIVVIAAIVIVSQFSAQEVSSRTYLWTALLVVRGFLPPGPAESSGAGIALLVVGLAFSVGFGYYRGRFMPMWRDQAGRLVRKGNKAVALLWAANLAERLVLGGIGAALFGDPFNGNALWLGMGVTLAAQQWVMLRRAPGISAGAAGEVAA